MAERRYLDSCVFISYIAETEDRGTEIETVLAEGREGKVELYASTITVAEVAFGIDTGSTGTIDSATEFKIDALWEPGSPVTLVEAHLGIMYLARFFMREQRQVGKGLRPMDAIHLATAAHYEIPMVFTYDTKLHGLSGFKGLTITEPKPLENRLALGTPLPGLPPE